MGSFTEIVLSFDFAKSTPDHVLAAFSTLAATDQPDDAPVLPDPVSEAWGVWDPIWGTTGLPEGQPDPHEHEPWCHDWASWVSTTMSVTTTPHGMLVWSDLGTWNLDCRFSLKTDAVAASKALAWLAPYVDTRKYGAERTLVGYAHYEYDPRPHLFWVTEGRWELEDLNPPDERS